MIMISLKYSNTQKSVLTATLLSSFLGPFLISSVNIALPDIEKEFGLSAVSLSWIVTSYLLSTAIFLIPIGRLADMKGEVKFFKLGMVIVTLSTLLCAISPNGLMLALMRAFQGLGAAMTMTTGAPLLLSNFSSSERGKMLGYNVAAVYLGLAVGPFVGGLLTRYLGWRSIFLFSAILGVAGIILAVLRLRHNIAVKNKGKFDLTGALLYGSALILIVYYSSHLNEPHGFLLLFLGIFLLLLFVFQCLKAKYPLFDTKLFTQNRIFAFSNIAALINYSATASIVFLMSLFLQKVKGLPPQVAGAILVSQPIVMALLSPYAGKLSDQIEPRILASAGMFMNFIGLLFLSYVDQETPLPLIIAVLLFMGLGFAFFSSPNMNTIMSSVEKNQMSTASGTASTMRIIGQMVSMTIVTLAFSTAFNGSGISQVPDYLFVNTTRFVYLVCSGMCLSGVFFSYSRGDLRK
jgi:EmrB/QacA subfamily drug resistance transporter